MRSSNLINSLNLKNYKILEIWHSEESTERKFYLTGDFRPANKENDFHSIHRCSDITKIIYAQSSIYINDVNILQSVITELEQLPMITAKQFSKDHSYIWHIQ